MPFTGERTEWPGNVVVSKHVNAHAQGRSQYKTLVSLFHDKANVNFK